MKRDMAQRDVMMRDMMNRDVSYFTTDAAVTGAARLILRD